MQNVHIVNKIMVTKHEINCRFTKKNVVNNGYEHNYPDCTLSLISRHVVACCLEDFHVAVVIVAF